MRITTILPRRWLARAHLWRIFAPTPAGSLVACCLPALAAALCLLSSAGPASAHGGVSATADRGCLMTIGPYKMNFTGYQPEAAKTETFCDDIPYTGASIVVLDEIDKVLRRMTLEFRILNDVKNLGITAQYHQLGSQEEIEAATLFLKPASTYPQGTVTVETNLDKGRYIGLVTLTDPLTSQKFYSVFPFSVGYGLISSETWMIYIGGALLIAVLLGFGYVAFFHQHKPGKTAARPAGRHS